MGIIAHIDAGKTTTSERMLYYSGFTRKMGDVDDGDTVMDYWTQERERGITINSAAISFPWKHHTITLIDTPGHVDFTFEVERSMRVLDGAVALFDGSAGVEAQSIAVWRQAKHYQVPSIAFLNKMDKPGASVDLSLDSMRSKLKATPLLTQLPIGSGRDFTGVIDLIAMETLLWQRGTDGVDFKRIPLVRKSGNGEMDFTTFHNPPESTLNRDTVEQAAALREHLADQVMTLDSQLLEEAIAHSLEPAVLSEQHLRAGLRRLTLDCQATPVLCGSSLRNCAVQPLLDAIVTYLPSPSEGTRKTHVPEVLRGLYAYAFKVSHDPQRGLLVYLRLYAGSISPQTTVYNTTRQTEERVSRVLLMLAGGQREVRSMPEGSIAVVVGLKNTYTGDVIVESSAVAMVAQDAKETVCPQATPPLELEAPPPVFHCSVELASAAQQKDLDQALHRLTREDPSLQVSVNEETGQTVLSGMGELHLEVVHDRLRREHRLDCSLGQLQVAYRETPTTSVSQEASQECVVAGARHSVSLSLTLSPCCEEHPPNAHPVVTLSPSISKKLASGGGGEGEGQSGGLRAAIEDGVVSGCMQGPLLGCPVQGVAVHVRTLALGQSTTPPAVVSACVADAVSRALRESGVQLLEPFTQLVVVVPDCHVGVVLSDLASQRRALVREVDSQLGQDDYKVITASAPLATLVGYSSALHSLTSGTATFSAAFSEFAPVSREVERGIVNQMRGYLS